MKVQDIGQYISSDFLLDPERSNVNNQSKLFHSEEQGANSLSAQSFQEQSPKVKRNTKRSRRSRNQTRKGSDYRKNICGYITKKVVREFTSQTYQKRVRKLCDSYHTDYQKAIQFYKNNIQRITGPSHIPLLIHAEDILEISMKKAFTTFFKWFLKQRYIRYLASEGKMAQKREYIGYKNKVLLPILMAQKSSFEINAELTEDSSSLMEQQGSD